VLSRLGALVFLAAVAGATTAATPSPQIKESCKGFDVELISASGDAMEDDMAVTVVFGKKRVPVSLPKALYVPRHPLLNVKNLCKELTAIEVGKDRALLLVAHNARPHYDRLNAVLIDTKEQKVLDVRVDIGEIKNEGDVLVVRSSNPRFVEVRLISNYLANSGCDCAEAAIEDWRRILFAGDKLDARDRAFPGAQQRRRDPSQRFGGRKRR
jgi:hypothetical protein